MVSYRTTFPILLLNPVSFLLSSFCDERTPGWRDALTVTSVGFSPLKQTRGWSPADVKALHSPKLLPQREIILSKVR